MSAFAAYLFFRIFPFPEDLRRDTKSAEAQRRWGQRGAEAEKRDSKRVCAAAGPCRGASSAGGQPSGGAAARAAGRLRRQVQDTIITQSGHLRHLRPLARFPRLHPHFCLPFPIIPALSPLLRRGPGLRPRPLFCLPTPAPSCPHVADQLAPVPLN